MSHDHWIEQLRFAVEVFDERGNLKEVLARLHDSRRGKSGLWSLPAEVPGQANLPMSGRANPATERS
jgi:hypothetical protein